MRHAILRCMNHKIAIFDIDGTIAEKSVIPDSILLGFRNIQESGYITTLSTGRAYQRLRDAFTNEFETLVSPDALIIVEHGTKIVRRNGEVVWADYFTKKEADHFVDFIKANADMIQFASYAPSDPLDRMQIWVKDSERLENTAKERSYADVFHCSYEELKKRIGMDSISHFVARLQDYIVVENLKLRFTRSDMDLILMDGYMQFIGNLSDKAKAIKYLENHYTVPVANMLIAGNGVNDVDMLNLDAGHRILVGESNTTPMVLAQLQSQTKVVRVASPHALGEYLQQLS